MLNSLGNFHLEKNNGNNFLFDEVYDNTLCDYLASSTVSDIWSPTHDAYNAHHLFTNNGWNACRPTPDWSELINGLLTTVIDYHTKRGNAHANLRDTKNYLLSQEKVPESGHVYNVTHVRLINPNPRKVDMLQDFMDVSEVIFDNILKDRPHPSIWKDLEAEMTMFNSRGSKIDLIRKRKIIEDHPSTWYWERQYEYFSNLWLRVEQGIYLSQNGGIRRVTDKIPIHIDWRTQIPQTMPFDTFFRNGRTQYGSNSYDIFKYIIRLFQHLHEVQNRSYCFIYKNKTSDTYFKMNEYVELVVSECFPQFHVDVFKGLVNKNTQI